MGVIHPSGPSVNPAPGPIRHLFPVEPPPRQAIRDEGAPPYDGRPAKGSRHVTRIEDATVEAVCARCGKDTQVPFKPTAGRDVFCRDCFRGSGR